MWFKLLVSMHYLLERCGLIVVHALFVWNLLLIPQMCVIMTIFCYVFWQAYPSLIAKGKCLKMPIPSECIKCFSTAPRVEHLTSRPRRGLGTFLSVSAFNHERASMSCSQQLNTFAANTWPNNSLQLSHPVASKSSPDSTQHCEWHHVTVGKGGRSVHMPIHVLP